MSLGFADTGIPYSIAGYSHKFGEVAYGFAISHSSVIDGRPQHFQCGMVIAVLLTKVKDAESWKCKSTLHDLHTSSIKPRIHSKVSG